MSVDQTEFEASKTNLKAPHKRNRVVLTIPPHLRMWVDNNLPAEFSSAAAFYNRLIELGIGTLTEESTRDDWIEHCKEMLGSDREDMYYWPGMRIFY